MNLPTVDLHPETIKHLKLGHFWVTKDSFTEKFPKNESLLIGRHGKTKEVFGLFFHDPEHKDVKARLFTTENLKDYPSSLPNEIKQRMDQAIIKRIQLKIEERRENYYLINSESDKLPGLLVLKLKDQILIQYYAFYWKKHQQLLIDSINEIWKKYFSYPLKNIWIQTRSHSQKKEIESIKGETQSEFVLKEFDINYLVRIDQYYDHGIYTDMSAIRFEIAQKIKPQTSFLNLFSYTGAYSLMALKAGCQNVVSVDLSKKYLEWLDKNISLNKNLNPNFHQSLNLNVMDALIKLKGQNQKFDYILCDPPSFSSDGKSKTSAFLAYEEIFIKMLEILSPNGILFVFLNTHHIGFSKFEQKLKSILLNSPFQNNVTIGKRYRLKEDCEGLKGFPESDYLKGFQIEFINKTKVKDKP